MFGDIIYQHDDADYAEFLVAEHAQARVQVICCMQGGQIKLFRIEWTDTDGYAHNTAVYDLFNAFGAFKVRIADNTPE